MKWKKTASMETPRDKFGATAIEEKIYVAGGFNIDDDDDNDNYGKLSSVEVYDSIFNEWSPFPNMNHKRAGFGLKSVGGQVYAIGGSGGDSDSLSGEMFDPATNKWTAIPDMKEGRVCCAACAIGDELYVIGGYDGNKSVSLVEVFNTKEQKWSSLPNMIIERHGCAAVSLGRKIYVFGGYDTDSRDYLSSAEVYDIHTQEWIELPQMKEKRCNCAATAVGNTIYIFGGEDNHFKYHSSCEVFDTSTYTWSSIPEIMEKRHGCQAITVGTKIYVMGGRNQFSTYSSLEIFETSSSTDTYTLSEQTGTRKRAHSQMIQSKSEEICNADTGPNDHNPPIAELHRSREHSITPNDIPTYKCSRNLKDRLIFLEDKSGLKHKSSELLFRRIEYLEMNAFGDVKNAGEPFTGRMKSLETAFFGH